MPNPFTGESRDARLGIKVEGWCDTLRAPESLHRLFMEAKPGHVSIGDFALKAMLDAHLMALMVAGQYTRIYSLLGNLFSGELPTGNHTRPPLPSGNSSAFKLPDGYRAAQAEALGEHQRGDGARP
jgi:hypothetical protein